MKYAAAVMPLSTNAATRDWQPTTGNAPKTSSMMPAILLNPVNGTARIGPTG